VKLLFITPSYEPRKDGVGDYTRRLIAQMASESAENQSGVISWNDSFAETIKANDTELRLPDHLAESAKLAAAQSFVRSFSPDWISLQWVPYGYQAKGLFYKQIKSLSTLSKGIPLHLMVHEIWLGAKMESNLKERLYGVLQKRLFKKLLRDLAPRCIHTQCKAYQHVLNRTGISAEYLPLFGNIAPVGSVEKLPESIRIGLFGAIHPEFNLEPFIPRLVELGNRVERAIHIYHAGRISEKEHHRFHEWKKKWEHSLHFQLFGEMEENALSSYLFSLDFGLSTNPLALWDKSGTNAAMFEHGLPVINLRDDVHFKGFISLSDNPLFLHQPSVDRLKEWLSAVYPSSP